MAKIDEIGLTLADAERLFSEKINHLRAEVGYLENQVNTMKAQAASLQGDVVELSNQIAEKTALRDQLTEEVTSANSSLEQHRQKTMGTLDAREKAAEARIDQAESAETKLHAKEQQLLARAGRLTSIRQDLEEHLDSAVSSLAEVCAKLKVDLSKLD